MAKLSKKTNKTKHSTQGIPMIAFVSMSAGALFGYLGGEFVLFAQPHPLHWVSAIALGFIGYLLGTLFFRLIGDIL